MNAPDIAVHAGFRMLPLDQVHESKLNPRKHFDKDRLVELAESIKAKGVLQPIVARFNQKGFEVACGARRVRAAKAAGLTEIPAIVRELTDQELLELACIENLQRADVHPLEEAEGYEHLLKLPGNTAETLATKVGKSRAYIYGRLKLCALGKAGREALYADKLDPSTALLIARIPGEDLQKEALEKLLELREYGDVSSYREAADFIHNEYMLRLKDAPFDVKAIYFAGKTTAVIGVPCGECPKRTGNQPELFADVKGADVCTDPACFKAKREAHAMVLVAKAKETGKPVISGKEAKKVMPYEHSGLKGFARPDEPCHDDIKGRTFRQILGKDMPPLQLLQNPHSGDVLEVVPARALQEALKKAGLTKRATGGNDRYAAEQKARENKARLETAIRMRTFAEISAAHQGAMFERAGHEEQKRLLQLRQPDIAKELKDNVWKHAKAFAKEIAAMAPKDLVVLMVQLAVVGEIHVGGYSPQPSERLFDAAKRAGVDVAKIRAELTGAARDKAKAKKPAKKPAAKKVAA